VKPLDRALLLSHGACIPLLVTMEDHVLAGGFGSAVLEALQDADCPAAVERIGWPDKFCRARQQCRCCSARAMDWHRTTSTAGCSHAGATLRTEHVEADV